MRSSNEGASVILRSDRFLRTAMKDHGASVWRVALSQTGSVAEAEDVYQDVFIALAQNTVSFTDDEHIKAWLLRVVINKCRDTGRSTRKNREICLDNLGFEPKAEESKYLDRDHEIWDAVRALPDHMRIAIYLFYVEGYSGEEVASLLDTTPSTIRTHLQRARERLRNILGGKHHEDS